MLDSNSDTLTDALSRVGHHYWKTKTPGGGGARLVRESQPMRPGHDLSVRWSSHTEVSNVKEDKERERPIELARGKVAKLGGDSLREGDSFEGT